MDLFSPLPSENHIVVIQDLESRYPVAKDVRSTNAKSVIPVLEDTYNTFDNPQGQKSDNGPPFNSKENLTSKRDIKQVKIPPGHLSTINVDTVTKPLGKAMKIGHFQNRNETETLNSFLVNYRDTPHLSTGVAPAHMIFRDEYRSNLPHKSISEEIVVSARDTDNCIKTRRKLDYNSLQNVRPCNFEIGDNVLVTNYKKSTKYDLFYFPKEFQVADILAKGNILVKDSNSSVYFKKHLNDLKRVNKDITFNEEKNQK